MRKRQDTDQAEEDLSYEVQYRKTVQPKVTSRRHQKAKGRPGGKQFDGMHHRRSKEDVLVSESGAPDGTTLTIVPF